MENPSSDELAMLAMTERELFSLYAQYPEIDFDPECCQRTADSSQHFSSPASNAGKRDETDSVQASDSTRHTTPMRHDLFNTSSTINDEYSSFCLKLQDCDLPQETVRCFTQLGSQFIELGRLVMNQNSSNAVRTSEDPVKEISNILLPQLEQSATKVQKQTETIAFVTEFTPFNILPTDISLWSNYKQRAFLICKYLSCPSQTELDLLTHLLRIFDAYVYNPHLNLREYHDVNHSSTTNESINHSINPAVTLLPCQQVIVLYNALLTLLSSYQRWLRALLLFRKTYMTPLMRRIQNSPWILKDIEATETTFEAAKLVLSRANEKDGKNGKNPPVGINLSREELQRVLAWADKRDRERSRVASTGKCANILEEENENENIGADPAPKEGSVPESGSKSGPVPGVEPRPRRRYTHALRSRNIS